MILKAATITNHGHLEKEDQIIQVGGASRLAEHEKCNFLVIHFEAILGSITGMEITMQKMSKFFQIKYLRRKVV